MSQSVSYIYQLECKIRQLKPKAEKCIDLENRIYYTDIGFKKLEQEIKQLKEELKEITASCDLWFKDAQRLKQKLEKVNELSKRITQIKSGNKVYQTDLYFKLTIDTIENELKKILDSQEKE